MRKYKWDNVHWARCGHRFCRSCITKRGRNWGNRNDRHNTKRELKGMA